MPNMASVVFLIVAISSTDSHSIQMESWDACKKVIDPLGRNPGGSAAVDCRKYPPRGPRERPLTA